MKPVILITGATRGIGFAAARQLAARGALVIIASRDGARAAEAAARVEDGACSVALNITVQSYDQQMDFGLMADAAAMPDVRALADALRVAFDDLCLLDAELNTPPTLADTDRIPSDNAITGTGSLRHCIATCCGRFELP